jgi:hypothetical protein
MWDLGVHYRVLALSIFKAFLASLAAPIVIGNKVVIPEGAA